MGGTVMKPQAQIILEQGIEQGMAKGEIKTLAGLVRDKILTPAQAAERISLTVDAFVSQCKKYNLSL